MTRQAPYGSGERARNHCRRAAAVPISNGVVDAGSVLSLCRDNLAAFKMPREITFLTELPRNVGGKILKTALRESMKLLLRTALSHSHLWERSGHAAAQLGRDRLWPAREAQQRIVDDLFGKFDAYGLTVTLIRMLGDHGNIAVE